MIIPEAAFSLLAEYFVDPNIPSKSSCCQVVGQTRLYLRILSDFKNQQRISLGELG
jgi:hypothetical protein